jgi:hypothetical protein
MIDIMWWLLGGKFRLAAAIGSRFRLHIIFIYDEHVNMELTHTANRNH